MSNELSVDRNLGLRVGYLVQRIEENTLTGTEGILRAIHRPAAGRHFTYLVEWTDGSGMEDFPRQKIALSSFGDFPHWDTPEARKNSWTAGDGHVWILFQRRLDRGKDFGSCLYCGQMRQYLAERNDGECRGPVKVGFASSLL